MPAPTREESIRQVRRDLASAFNAFGYRYVEPPVLARPDAFLRRSGEAIRRRMYFFEGPTGEERCLRPELTIPTCQGYVSRGPAPGVSRLWSSGPVFQVDAAGDGEGERLQAGAECLGAAHRAGADAEILGLAWACLDAVGHAPRARIAVGDLGLWRTFVDGLGLDPGTAALLKSRPGWTTPPADPTNAALRRAVAPLPADQREAVLSRVMELGGIRPVGARGLDEIAGRFFAPSAGDDVPAEAAAAADRFYETGGAFPEGLDRVEALAGEARIDLDAPLDALRSLAETAAAYGLSPDHLDFAPVAHRDLEIYTGLVFDVRLEGAGDVVGGGGRYDNLVGALTGETTHAPAVGFSLWIQALANAGRPRTSEGARVRVLPAGDVEPIACVRAAQAVRAAGLPAALDLSGETLRDALRHAGRDDVTHLVLVGEDEWARGAVRVRDLSGRVETEVTLDALGAHLWAVEP